MTDDLRKQLEDLTDDYLWLFRAATDARLLLREARQDFPQMSADMKQRISSVDARISDLIQRPPHLSKG